MVSEGRKYWRVSSALRAIASAWRAWVVLGALSVLAGVGFWLRWDPDPPWIALAIAESEQAALTFLYVAQAEHFLEDERLHVTLRPEQDGRTALVSMLRGDADLAVAYDFSVVASALAGDPLAVLASLHDSHRNVAILARRDRGVAVPRDLAHKRIGIAAGTGSEYYAYSLLTFYGISRDEVHLRDYPWPRLLGALERGEVDAISTWNPVLWRGQKVLGSRGVTFAIDTYSENSLLVTTQSTASRSRDTLVRLLRALRRAEVFTQHNEAAARQITERRLGLDPESFDAVWEQTRLELKLDNLLVTLMDQEAVWLRATYPRRFHTTIPSFDRILYPTYLRSVAPYSVTLLGAVEGQSDGG
jgi:NitT/TauT family transport system substrate-binding protein